LAAPRISLRTMRALWPLAWLLLFRPSPRVQLFEPWRHFLLRLWGADVHKEARVYPSAWIEEPWSVDLGEYSMVGEGAQLWGLAILMHHAVVSQQAAVDCSTLCHDSWVCARAYVHNAEIGAGAVVGACAVVTDQNIPPYAVVAGNPARVIKQRELKCEPSSACP
jgi:putative colanic acid biosynthesis acetyltransferase WcaF